LAGGGFGIALFVVTPFVGWDNNGQLRANDFDPGMIVVETRFVGGTTVERKSSGRSTAADLEPVIINGETPPVARPWAGG
jgi:hypothetical protein